MLVGEDHFDVCDVILGVVDFSQLPKQLFRRFRVVIKNFLHAGDLLGCLLFVHLQVLHPLFFFHDLLRRRFEMKHCVDTLRFTDLYEFRPGSPGGVAEDVLLN